MMKDRNWSAALAATVAGLGIIFAGIAFAEELQIIDKPLPLKNSRPRSEDTVDMILIHFSSDVVANPQSPYDPDRVIGIFERYGVSAHYLIDREGKVYRLVDESRAAYHAGKGEVPGKPERKNNLNEYSIGIEVLAMGTYDDMKIFMSKEKYESLRPEDIGYTEAQYKSLKALIDDIVKRHPAIKKDREHIIGHDEYAPERKTDPGELFDWSKIGL